MLSPKTQKLIAMLGSDNESERLAACNALKGALKADGMDFHDLARGVKTIRERVVVSPPPPPPPPPAASWPEGADRPWRIQRTALMALGPQRFTKKEWTFLSDLGDWRGNITARQGEWLTALALREGVFV